MSKIEEFKVNKSISLKIEGKKTFIYINNTIFRQCKSLFLNDLSKFRDIKSIDEAIDSSYQFNHFSKIISLKPEEEFFGHCSNIQVWVENNYDTTLLHRNLSFPLLRKLTELGDNKAKTRLKEEIVRRYIEGSSYTREFLLRENYLDYLDDSVLLDILEIDNIEIFKKIKKKIDCKLLFGSFNDGPLYDRLVSNQIGISLKEKKIYGLTLANFSIRKSEWNYLFKKFEILNNSLRSISILNCDSIYIPRRISLDKLEYLRITNSRLSRINHWLSKLSKLKKLILSNIFLNYVDPNIFNLSKLEYLDLSFNLLSKTPKKLNLPELEVLKLNNNLLNHLPRSIGKLDLLETLHIENNRIKKIPRNIQKLENLKYFFYNLTFKVIFSNKISLLLLNKPCFFATTQKLDCFKLLQV